MGWEKTITKQGLSVLAGLDDDNVKIVSAWAGTGTFDSENLYERIGLVDPKQSLPIIEDAKVGNKRILRLQVTNAKLDVGYQLNQLGVFISVNNGDPILYYLAQNEFGDEIPSNKVAPGFVSEYIVTLIFTYGTDPDIDCSEIGFISPDALDARIDSFKNEILAKYDDIAKNATVIHVSESKPEDWQPGEWWYQAVNVREISGDTTITETLNTIPYDPNRMYHVVVDGNMETVTNFDVGSLIVKEI